MKRRPKQVLQEENPRAGRLGWRTARADRGLAAGDQPDGVAARAAAAPGVTCRKRIKQATLHSITSSALTSSDCGTVKPSALAVLRLMIRSNFRGCSTGMSAGLAPFRISPT